MTPHRFFLATLVAMLFFVTAGCTVNYTEPPRAVYDDPAPPPPPPPDQEFYELNEHGEWIDIYPHGLVWRPYVTTDWRPYIYGHWVWSEWGWTWVSYEPFGWAVYHYGYWRYSPAWGWIWIPGYDWAPVLVQWVWFEDYCVASTSPGHGIVASGSRVKSSSCPCSR